MKRAAHNGVPCPWCGRAMDARGSPHGLLPTVDHHPIPKSQGGQKTKICCGRCNGVKGHYTGEEWVLFMELNPQWWRMTGHELREAHKRTRRRLVADQVAGRPSRALTTLQNGAMGPALATDGATNGE